MQVTIREMKPGDLPAVLELLREFAEFEKLVQFCTATEDRFHRAIFGEEAFVEGLIIDCGQTIAGCALFYPCFSSFRGERGLYLEDIYLKPGFRGGGTGKRVISEIARIASERGYERIDFQVLDRNKDAIGFYRSLGAESNDDETHFKFAGEAFRRLANGQS